MYHIRSDFRPGTKAFAIPLSWFRSVAEFINSLCSGTGIRMTNPAHPGTESPVRISVDETWLKQKVAEFAPAQTASYTAGDGIDAAALAQGEIAVDPEQVVMIEESEGEDEPTESMIPSTSSGIDLEETSWEAGNQRGLSIPIFTRIVRRRDIASLNDPTSHYAYAFYRTFTFNPNGTLASMSEEQGFYVFALS